MREEVSSLETQEMESGSVDDYYGTVRTTGGDSGSSTLSLLEK